MTARRVTLLILLLLALATAAAAGWLYLNLPAIIASQGREYLAGYGVESIETTRPRLGYGEVRLDGLTLSGARDGIQFQATLAGVDIAYDVASLSVGELRRVDIGKLAVTLAITPSPSPPASEPTPPLALDELLPRSVADLLPVGALSIGELSLDVTGTDLPPVAARGSLAVTQGLQLQLQLDAQSLGLQLQLSLDTGESLADARIRLRAHRGDTRLAQLAARSSRSRNRNREGEWSWQLDGGIELGALGEWLSTRGASAALPLDPVTLETLGRLRPQGSATLGGVLAHGDRIAPDTFIDTLVAELELLGENLSLHPDGDEHTLRGRLRAQLTLTPGLKRLVLSESAVEGSVSSTLFTLGPEARKALGWGASTRVSWRQAGDIELAMMPDGNITLQLGAASVELASGTTELALALTKTVTGLHPDAPMKPQVDTGFAVSGTLRDRPIPPVSGSLRLADEAGGDTQSIGLQLTEPAGTLSLALTGSGIPLDGTGQYRVRAQLAQAAGAIAHYLPLLPPGATPATVPELRAGSVSFSARIEANGWEAPGRWQWQSALDISDLALAYDAYTVDGLSLEAAWRGLEQWQTTGPATLAVQRIDVGFPIEQVSAQVSLPRPTPPGAPQLRLENLQMSLLGGRAFLPEPQAWDFSSQRNSLALQVEDLALGDIVALQQNRQISAEGRLSGLIPVSLDGPRLTIDRGHVTAAPGGVIRYRPDEASAAIAGSSRELGLAMQLLRNFHYDVLASEVALDESGILLLGLSLAGRNPEYEGGRAVNFNINLEQNIDPLLQSLQLGGSVSKQLENKRR